MMMLLMVFVLCCFLRTGSLALVGSLASAQYLTRTGTHARTRPFTVWLRPERDWRPDPDTMRRAKKREKSRGDRLGTAAPAARLASASTPGSGMAAVNSPAPSSSVLASFSSTSSPGLHPRRRACPLRLCTRPPRTSTPGVQVVCFGEGGTSSLATRRCAQPRAHRAGSSMSLIAAATCPQMFWRNKRLVHSPEEADGLNRGHDVQSEGFLIRQSGTRAPPCGNVLSSRRGKLSKSSFCNDLKSTSSHIVLSGQLPCTTP